MKTNSPTPFTLEALPRFTHHALARMEQRAISHDAIAAALDWGRWWYSHGCLVFVLGRREIRKARRFGLDLSAYEGIRVVEDNSAIITAAHSHPGRYRPRVCHRRQRRKARKNKFLEGWS